MGYVEETGAAQHWRDARIAPIYEGTNGIQAIDLVTRKLTRDHGASMHMLIDECRAMLAGSGSLPPEAEFAPVAEVVAAGLDHLAAATKWILARERDPEQVLYVASPYLRLAGIALGAALLVKAALAAARLAPVREGYAARLASAMIFADELAVEIPALWRKIASPTATREAWADVLV
jgi:hypothetical protein